MSVQYGAVQHNHNAAGRVPWRSYLQCDAALCRFVATDRVLRRAVLLWRKPQPFYKMQPWMGDRLCVA